METVSTDLNRNPLRWLLTAVVMVLPLLASFFYFVWYPGTTFGNSLYVGVKILLFVWPFIAVWFVLREKFSDHSRPKDHKSSLIAGAVFGLVTVSTLFALVKLTPVGDVVYGNADRIAGRIDDLGVRKLFIPFAIFLSFVHSGLEEFFWRYFAFGQLRKLIPLAGAVIAAALGFAAHHIVILTQFVPVMYAVPLGLCVGIGGAVWSLIYHRTNSLWGAWVSHVIIDLGIMWIGWEILQMP